MADFNAVAKEIFQVLRSFDYTVRLYDENGMAVNEPDKARRMMAYPKNLMVSLLDDDDNSRITLSMGKSVHINDVMGLNQKLRTLATKYNMIFRTQQYGKVINPKQFADLATITERKDSGMQVFEHMYGTSHSSYLRLDNARMIVRHRTDESQRRIQAIFVEAGGHRAQLPTTNLLAGCAMVQHLNQGGQVVDRIGEQINALALDYVTAVRPTRRRLCETLAQLALPHSYSQASRLLERREEPMISVLGQRVSEPAWSALRANSLPIKGRPTFAGMRFTSPIDEIAYRLSQIADRVQDDSMANLLNVVAERLPQEPDKAKRDKYKIIAVQALRATDCMPHHQLAKKNEAVVEHLRWLHRFDPDRLLTEVGHSPMDPYFPHDLYDNASDGAIRDFDAEEFVDSPEMQDVISGRNPHDPEENELTRDEISGALESYLRHYVEMNTPEFESGFDDTNGMAEAVFSQAADALHKRGFVIADSGLAENEMSGDEELTIEDILLPKRSQTTDLTHDVTKDDVADDAVDQQQDYTSRLMTLAGMRR